MPRTADTSENRSGFTALSDQELVERIRSASEPHFNELYQRYFQRIYNFIFVRIRNHADTEEIVQEVFTIVFRSIDAFGGRSSLLAWVYGIAKNTVNNHIRKQRNLDEKLERAQPSLARAEPSIASCTPEEQLQLRRYAEAVNERLESVAKWQRDVFLLRHVENLTINQIAERTHRSNDAIRSSLYRVKRLLVEASDSGLVAAGR